MRGVNVLLLANTGTEAVPVWTPVGGQRGATLTEEVDTIETTSKDSASLMKEFDYAFGSWNISCDGIYIPGEAAYTAIKTAMRTKKRIKVKITEDADGAGGAAAVGVEEGFAIVTSREMDMPYDDSVTYSIELQGTGALTTPS
jgi:TP901-1 family phage major tail protein